MGPLLRAPARPLAGQASTLASELQRHLQMAPPEGLCLDRVASAIQPSLAAVRLRTAYELWLAGVLHDFHRMSLVKPSTSRAVTARSASAELRG
jgi:hypothetical protein